MTEKLIGHGTVYGQGSPRDLLQPVNTSEQTTAEQAARSQRRDHPVEDPALLGFDPYA